MTKDDVDVAFSQLLSDGRSLRSALATLRESFQVELDWLRDHGLQCTGHDQPAGGWRGDSNY